MGRDRRLARRERKELSGAAPHTTKNRIADAAPVEGARSLLANSRVCIVTPLMLDSTTKRIASWTRKAWKTAASPPVKNHDLPRAVDAGLAVAAAAPTAAA